MDSVEFIVYLIFIALSWFEDYDFLGFMGIFKYLAVMLLIIRGSFGYFSVDHMVLLITSTVFMCLPTWSFLMFGLYVYVLRFHSHFYFKKKALTLVQYF